MVKQLSPRTRALALCSAPREQLAGRKPESRRFTASLFREDEQILTLLWSGLFRRLIKAAGMRLLGNRDAVRHGGGHSEHARPDLNVTFYRSTKCNLVCLTSLGDDSPGVRWVYGGCAGCGIELEATW